MFVRPLVLLISNVLYCFSVLVCCKSLHQNMATKEQIGLKVKKWKSLPSAFKRTYGRTQGLGSNVGPVSLRSPSCPSRSYASSLQPCAMSSYLQLNAESTVKHSTCKLKRLRSNTHGAVMLLRLNAHQNVEHMRECGRMHHLRSNAPLTWLLVLFCL
jgi:hypothetical protein